MPQTFPPSGRSLAWLAVAFVAHFALALAAAAPPPGSLYRAGIAAREINPKRPTVVIGPASSPLHSERYNDLKVKATVVEDFAGERVAFVSADILHFEAEMADALKAKIAERFGLAPGRVVLNASHSHSGPPLSMRMVDSPDKLDAGYVAFFESQAVEVVGDALAAMRPATLRVVADSCDVAVNRRVTKDGRTSMLPNPRGSVDRDVVSLVLTDPGASDSEDDDEIFGVVVKYACHPVTTSVHWLGSSYPGIMMDEMERRRPGALVQFLQGCSGDCRPRLVDPGWTKFVPGTLELCREFGVDLADAVDRSIEKVGLALAGPVKSAASVVDLPVRPADRAEIESFLDSDAWYLKRWAERRRAELEGDGIATSVPFRVQVVQIGEGSLDFASVRYVAFDGEIFSGYSHAIQRRLFPFATVALGYCNGMAGYIPTAEEMPKGGYEVEAYRSWDGPGAFLPETEKIVLDEAERLARSLR